MALPSSRNRPRPTPSSSPATTGGRSSLAVGATPGVWSAQNTGPADVEAAIRALNRSQQGGDGVFAPARVLNLIVIVDREWRGGVYKTLPQGGRPPPPPTTPPAG